MEIKRYDIYVLGLVLLHLTILWRTLSLITAGSALQMMSIPNGFGYVMIAMFVGIFCTIFFNLSAILKITFKDKSKNISDDLSLLYPSGQRFLIVLLLYIFIELIQALHYMSQFGAQ